MSLTSYSRLGPFREGVPKGFKGISVEDLRRNIQSFAYSSKTNTADWVFVPKGAWHSLSSFFAYAVKASGVKTCR